MGAAVSLTILLTIKPCSLKNLRYFNDRIEYLRPEIFREFLFGWRQTKSLGPIQIC